MDETLTIQFDGGSRGNPGPAACGVVITTADGITLAALGKYLGRATNNVAEYTGLITGLQEAQKLGAKKLIIRGDSELVIKQMRGEYRVKNPDMKTLYDRAQTLAGEFASVQYTHNLRHHNEIADRLANKAMDRKADVSDNDVSLDAKPSPLDEPAARQPQAGDRWICERCGAVVQTVTPSQVRPHQLKAVVCQCGQGMMLR